jgi:uncharacterized protein YihD (DUF1040 family)
MRDPNRIARILEKLQKIWQSTPDLRLGQLLVNLTGEHLYTDLIWHLIWHFEDDRLEERLDRYLQTGSFNPPFTL